MNRKMNFLLVCSFVMLSQVGFAQADRYVAGTHYTVLSAPARTADASKIEVVELFWYGCPHCFTFEPLIVNWAENAPADVAFSRYPAVFNSVMKIHAQMYFVAQSLDVLDKVHASIFEALTVQRKRLQTKEQIVEFFADRGVPADRVASAFDSFSVTTKMKQVERKMDEYKPRGTPAMVVNGKYLLMTDAAVPTQQEMLRIVDFLVEKERRAKLVAINN